MSPEEQKKVRTKALKGILRIGFIAGALFYIAYSFFAWIFRSIKNLFVKQEDEPQATDKPKE